MPRFAPTIPGERGGRRDKDGELNRLESQEARRLGLPRPELNRIALLGTAGLPFETGHAVTATLTTGLNTVPHGLGRASEGSYLIQDDAKPVYVDAYENVTQNVNTATVTQISFNTVSADWSGNFAADTFTAPHTGIYRIDMGGSLDNVTNDAYASFWIGGSTYGTFATGSGNAGGDVRQCIGATVQLTVTETVIGKVYHASGGPLNMLAGRDDTWINIRSDESLTIYNADATNIYVGSGRARTVKLWVW